MLKTALIQMLLQKKNTHWHTSPPLSTAALRWPLSHPHHPSDGVWPSPVVVMICTSLPPFFCACECPFFGCFKGYGELNTDCYTTYNGALAHKCHNGANIVQEFVSAKSLNVNICMSVYMHVLVLSAIVFLSAPPHARPPDTVHSHPPSTSTDVRLIYLCLSTLKKSCDASRINSLGIIHSRKRTCDGRQSLVFRQQRGNALDIRCGIPWPDGAYDSAE